MCAQRSILTLMRTAWILQGVGYAVLFAGLWLTLEWHDAPVASDPYTLSLEYVGNSTTTMKVRSPAFAHEELIPSKYTCDGENMSPPLVVEEVPEGAVSLVLVMDDPDAPGSTWDHWVVYDIPAEEVYMGEGDEPEGTGGANSWGGTGYGGPCPPNGEHRYLFHVYALDTVLRLPEGATKDEVLRAIAGHVLESATLMGRYARTAR